MEFGHRKNVSLSYHHIIKIVMMTSVYALHAFMAPQSIGRAANFETVIRHKSWLVWVKGSFPPKNLRWIYIGSGTVDGSEIWRENHLWCINPVNNGISYLPQLVQDFWTINSMCWHSRMNRLLSPCCTGCGETPWVSSCRRPWKWALPPNLVTEPHRTLLGRR